MCKNVKYDVDSTSIVVDLCNVVKPKITCDDNDDGGIYFYKSYDVVGTSREVDDNGNMIGAIEFESTKVFILWLNLRIWFRKNFTDV